MSSSTNISALYREFADALTEGLAENAVGLAVSPDIFKQSKKWNVNYDRHCQRRDRCARRRANARR
jgi:hypothetical protein